LDDPIGLVVVEETILQTTLPRFKALNEARQIRILRKDLMRPASRERDVKLQSCFLCFTTRENSVEQTILVVQECQS